MNVMRIIVIAPCALLLGMLLGAVGIIFWSSPQEAGLPTPTPYEQAAAAPTPTKHWPSANLSAALRVPYENEPWFMGLTKPLSQTELPQSTDCSKAYKWAKQQGAVPVGDQQMILTFDAVREVEIRLLKVSARHVRGPKKLYIPGIDISCVPRNVPPDYDLQRGSARLSLASDEGGRHVWADDPNSWEARTVLRPGDTSSWQVDLTIDRAQRSAYYILNLDYELDGKRYSARLDDHGTPFFITQGAGYMGHSPPSYDFRAKPRPHFTYRPAQCTTPSDPTVYRRCERQPSFAPGPP